MDNEAPPLFSDQEWVRKPVDPDEPVWIVYHTNVDLHERSNFFLLKLEKAADMPKLIYYEKQDCTILGSFDAESEAIAFRDFCILKRSKQYTPYINQAFELNSQRNFLARIQVSNLVPYDSWILITAHDYKLLQAIVPIQPANPEDLESIDNAWCIVGIGCVCIAKELPLVMKSFGRIQTI